MSISVASEGFCHGGRWVAWLAVEAIAAYKRDLITYDDICLAFKVEDSSWVEMSEDEPGFETLMAEVERRYPEMPPDWFREVMHPAFAPNYRVLWERA